MTATKPTFLHGTVSGYVYRKCRCDECKAAMSAYNAARYAKDIERRRARNRSYAKANAAAALERAHRWRREHPDKWKSQQRNYYLNNLEKRSQYRADHRATLSAYQSEYRKAHPELLAEHSNRRRARKLGAPTFLITSRDWLRLCERYRNRCAYCGTRTTLTQDHVVPLARGGRHSIGNLLPACGSCNSSKHSLLLIEWRIRRRKQ